LIATPAYFFYFCAEQLVDVACQQRWLAESTSLSSSASNTGTKAQTKIRSLLALIVPVGFFCYAGQAGRAIARLLKSSNFVEDLLQIHALL